MRGCVERGDGSACGSNIAGPNDRFCSPPRVLSGLENRMGQGDEGSPSNAQVFYTLRWCPSRYRVWPSLASQDGRGDRRTCPILDASQTVLAAS